MDELKRLNIELSAHCGYKCVSCPNTYMERNKGHMSLDLFNRIFDEIDGRVQKVFLWNYGESLLNPNVGSMIYRTQDSSTYTVLSTTGSRLTKLEDLRFLGALDELIISINGLTQEIYEFHQVNGNLDNVKRGLARIAPIMEGSDTEYILQFVANLRNLEQVKELNDFAMEFCFKRVVVKSFNVMDGSDQTFRDFVPVGTKFSRYKQDKKTYIPPEDKIEPCLEWMVINHNGDVNPCCWDYRGEYIMGNVGEEGVYVVWNSKKMIEHRKMIKSRHYLPICVDCKNGKVVMDWEVEK